MGCVQFIVHGSKHAGIEATNLGVLDSSKRDGHHSFEVVESSYALSCWSS